MGPSRSVHNKRSVCGFRWDAEDCPDRLKGQQEGEAEVFIIKGVCVASDGMPRIALTD